MRAASIGISLLVLIATMSSTAYGDKPAGKPRQFVLSLRFCVQEISQTEGLPADNEETVRDHKTVNRPYIVSQPELLLTEDVAATCMVGGERLSGAKKDGVFYGTRLDARARARSDGRIQLDFVAEHSTPQTPESSDFDRQWSLRSKYALAETLIWPRQGAAVLAVEAVLFVFDRAATDDSMVDTLPTEKAFGSVTMVPGATYRIVNGTFGSPKSWWELKIQDVSQSEFQNLAVRVNSSVPSTSK